MTEPRPPHHALLDRLLQLIRGETVDPAAVFAEGATFVAGPTTLTSAQLAERLAAQPGAEVLHAVSDPLGVAVQLEALDEASGLAHREAWMFEVRRGRLVRGSGCAEVLDAPHLTLPARPVEPYLAGFGLRRPELADQADQAAVQRAVDAVAAHLGRAVRFDPREVMLGDDLVYVPHGWIGCVGFLVPRSGGAPIQLGSGMPLRVHVWAYYRGFADGLTSADRPNDLVITAVRSVEAARRALERVVDHPSFEVLPLRLRSVDLYFSREALWRAELRGDMRFEVGVGT